MNRSVYDNIVMIMRLHGYDDPITRDALRERLRDVCGYAPSGRDLQDIINDLQEKYFIIPSERGYWSATSNDDVQRVRREAVRLNAYAESILVKVRRLHSIAYRIEHMKPHKWLQRNQTPMIFPIEREAVHESTS